MLGNIITIKENIVILQINPEILTQGNIIGYNVIFEDNDNMLVGEINSIELDKMYISIVGQLMGHVFVPGFIKKPAMNSLVRLINEDEIELLLGKQNQNDPGTLYLGESKVYLGYKICVNINSFFSNHFAVFGNTGSGKSYTVARLIQNIFYNQQMTPTRANIFIFDAYGEYQNAFDIFNQSNPKLNFKSYTTNYNDSSRELLRIPLWLLGVDDLALLLGATEHVQVSIIEKALKLITIFCQDEQLVITHKNDIIARALVDIILSSSPATQIRDQIIAVLSKFQTRDLNLESKIIQPGYTRTFKQCLFVDDHGKMGEIELVADFIKSFIRDGLEIELPDGSFGYNLKDLAEALEFALISEGVLKSDKVFDYTNTIKVRLHSIINSSTSLYFDYNGYVSKERYIKNILTAQNGYKAQIINFNINYIDDRLAKVITKIYSKLLFDFSAELKERASFPFHIILEEAHRYVQNDADVYLLGYNIFERIAKEGRKYGVILGLISQRPSELSETTLSQCANFLVLRMYHPKDLNYIKEMIPNITNEITAKSKLLQPGNCIAFGLAFKVPAVIQMDKPKPTPYSDNCDIVETWFERN